MRRLARAVSAVPLSRHSHPIARRATSRLAPVRELGHRNTTHARPCLHLLALTYCRALSVATSPAARALPPPPTSTPALTTLIGYKSHTLPFPHHPRTSSPPRPLLPPPTTSTSPELHRLRLSLHCRRHNPSPKTQARKNRRGKKICLGQASQRCASSPPIAIATEAPPVPSPPPLRAGEPKKKARAPQRPLWTGQIGLQAQQGCWVLTQHCSFCNSTHTCSFE